jgi:hypothetical protein
MPQLKASPAKTKTTKANAANAAPVVTTEPGQPRLSDADIEKLFAFLAFTKSCPVKIGANRGRGSSEPLVSPHVRVGGGQRNYAAIIFAAIATGTDIKPGAIVPRFFTLADTPLHVECGAGRNALRGRTTKAGTVRPVSLTAIDTGDAFQLTESVLAEFALVPASGVKQLRDAIATL